MTKRLLAISLAALVSSAAACATTGKPTSTTATSSSKPDPNLISTAEIDALPTVRDAYDVVLRLRPTWLTKAQVTGISMSGTRMGGSAGGSRGGVILVYLDNARLGDIASLKDLAASTVATIQFMDPATATALLPGLTSQVIAGAIVVHLRTGR